MIAFLKRTFLKQPIGTNTIKNNEKFLTPTNTITSRQCTPCFPRRSLFGQQVLKTTIFTSTELERPLQFFT